ncbi:MAG: M23 family metallopeptidase, partial [Pseudomonadota bacterium]
GYGKLIKIDHGGNFISYYGHLSKYNVKVGQKVYKGQKIGAVGSTGNSTGPHLHFEIRKSGVPQNPLKYLK